ncbi:hypothetical protein JWG45_20930 [Leptospira sp. 201903070]|uniref:Transcriptional antiterminator Rof n=1 Tax=Leptospira ainlahdjerensis TaxID=2810033 RepID=A0ABS2UGV9_9LEPT|nr:hypothetical protein [Leptospira ainlahdjerensis]MBM9579615.1 hypothetical protein [Leptospira ainlahdjerensis]
MNVYVPVSCEFYDRLEELVIRQRKVSLEVSENSEAQPRKMENVRILDLTSMNREEFAVLEDGEKIRLDYILKIIS